MAYPDGHVVWHVTPFCGSTYAQTRRDNIYARQLKKVGNDRLGVAANDKGDPIWGDPTDTIDEVLLPTADYKPQKP